MSKTRKRLKSSVGRKAVRRRGELVNRSFAHVLDRGGMRRTWLRGRENVHKRYLIHVAGFNLSLLMRAFHGSENPKGKSSEKSAIIFVWQVGEVLMILIVAVIHDKTAALVWRISSDKS
jgi:hypothetical protein